MNHIDLFSGIGGFALAAQWAGFKTVVFCEKDEFCQRVLQARFGAFVADSDNRLREFKDKEVQAGGNSAYDGPPLIPDIRDLDGAAWRGATLLTGGFPCQPFSAAGKRRGTEDDRHLWPEMLRVIAEARPRWVLGENVAGIINMELDTVLADLEGEGYEVGTVVIPAAAVNAPHRRDRVWIIGNAQGSRERIRQQERMDGPVFQEVGREQGRNSIDASDSHAPDSEFKKRSGWGAGTGRGKWSEKGPEGDAWEIPWIEVATEFCGVDARISNRVDRLKALGNAIVPQVAYEIIKGIMEIEKSLS